MPDFRLSPDITAAPGPRPTRQTPAQLAGGMVLLPNRGKLLIKGAPRAISGLPGSRWNGTHNGYELTLTLDTLTKVRETLGLTGAQMRPYVHPDLMRWVEAARASATEAEQALARIAVGYREPFDWRDNVGDANGQPRPPFDHQAIMATFAYAVDGAAFFCEMRTGKTRAWIEAMQKKVDTEQIDCAIVFCPTRAVGVWERELRTWSNLIPVRLDQSLAQRAEIMRRFVETGQHHGRVFITNYEAVARLRDDILPLLSQARWALNCDEAHRIKNPQAAMTRACIKIARLCPWRCVMTGTPVTNTGQDVWSQMYVTDMGVTFGANFPAFRDEFFLINSWSHESSMRPGADDTINARLQRRALRYRQRDCFDMPERLETVVPIVMTEAQRTAYNQMQDQLIATIGGDLPEWETDDEGNLIDAEGQLQGQSRAAIILTQYLRLSQITSGFLPLDDGVGVHYFLPNPKLDALEDEVRMRVEDNRSVIVWAWYKPDVKMIRERLADLDPALIIGGMDPRKVDAQQDRFQACETRVIIGNPGSGGTAIKLTAADTAIYYSQSWSLEHRSQSEARNQEPKSASGREALTYIDLCCPGTIDDIVRHRLVTKATLAETLVEVRRQLGI